VVLELGGRGLIGSHVTIFDLDRATNAYEALKAGEIEGRAVVVPNRQF
jgi:propanol-preferring alcohol dehydrogenase